MEMDEEVLKYTIAYWCAATGAIMFCVGLLVGALIGMYAP